MDYYIEAFMDTLCFGLLAGVQFQTEVYWFMVKAYYFIIPLDE